MDKLTEAIKLMIEKYDDIRNKYDDIPKKSTKSKGYYKKKAKPLYEGIEASLESKGVRDLFPHLKIRYSMGSGKFKSNPQIYFFDDRVTDTAKKGVYAGIFMVTNPKEKDREVGSFRFALTQGKNDAEKGKEKNVKRVHLRNNAQRISGDYCKELRDKGYDLASHKDLLHYTIISEKTFCVSEKISDDELLGDLSVLLSAYDEFAQDETDRTAKNCEFISYQQIKARRGQQKFRKNLINRYKKCIVTNCAIAEVLEAAHIIPHAMETDYSESNGLLMRADIHTLFDLNLLGIDNHGVVHISSKLYMNNDYSEYNGKVVIDEDDINTELKDNLKKRFELYETI